MCLFVCGDETSILQAAPLSAKHWSSLHLLAAVICGRHFDVYITCHANVGLAAYHIVLACRFKLSSSIINVGSVPCEQQSYSTKQAGLAAVCLCKKASA